MARDIKYIVLHCTGTSQKTSVSSILRYWKNEKGWRNPGYHFMIKPNGTIVNLLPLGSVANGARGYNSNGIHISYIGGINKAKKEKDTRTAAQFHSMAGLVKALRGAHPRAKVLGHRDLPGVTKFCPSFEVKKFIKKIDAR